MAQAHHKGIARGTAITLVTLLFFGNVLNYVDRQVLALLKPTLEAEFGWSDADYAHLGSAFQIAAAGALLFVGWFVDRLGVRIAYAVAITVWSAAGMAHALAQTVQQFVIARIVLAAGESVSTPAGLKGGNLPARCPAQRSHWSHQHRAQHRRHPNAIAHTALCSRFWLESRLHRDGRLGFCLAGSLVGGHTQS